MPSALRQAARRLGGGGVLQRSIAQEGRRRRLPTRLLHTPTPTTTRATKVVDDANAAVSRYAQIQEKREELYDLVEHIERTYKAPMRMSWRNSQLLHRLSTQVEPRPGDPYWRMCRRAQRKSSFFTAVGICSAGLSSGAAIAYGRHWLKRVVMPRSWRIGGTSK